MKLYALATQSKSGSYWQEWYNNTPFTIKCTASSSNGNGAGNPGEQTQHNEVSQPQDQQETHKNVASNKNKK